MSDRTTQHARALCRNAIPQPRGTGRTKGSIFRGSTSPMMLRWVQLQCENRGTHNACVPFMLLLDVFAPISFAPSLPAVASLAATMEEAAFSCAAREKHNLPRVRTIQTSDFKRAVLYFWLREYCTRAPLASQACHISFEERANWRLEVISFILYDEHAVDTVFLVLCYVRCGCMERWQHIHSMGERRLGRVVMMFYIM